jgi:hypothetical protein
VTHWLLLPRPMARWDSAETPHSPITVGSGFPPLSLGRLDS